MLWHFFLVPISCVIAAVSQVHLALTNHVLKCPQGIALSFASTQEGPHNIEYAPVGATSAPFRVKSRVKSYQVHHRSYNYVSPYLHTALLCDLTPSTEFSYRIIDSAKNNKFITPPLVGSSDVATVLGIVGDPGDTSDSATTVAHLVQQYQGLRTQALIIAGDYSYANGQHEEWDKWYNVQERVFSQYPSLGIPGNHETIVPHGHILTKNSKRKDIPGEDYLGYLNRVVTPLLADDVLHHRTYYSFDIGLIHLIFLDDYVGSRGSKENSVGTLRWKNERQRQLTWLVRDLKHVNRSATPYVLVVKHNPFYNSWSDHQCQCSKVPFEIYEDEREACWQGKYFTGDPMLEPACGWQAKLEPVFAEFGVDLVMTGHVHGYERTAPVLYNRIDHEHGITYVTTGAGGNYEGHAGPRLQSVPKWSKVVYNRKYGASKIVATRNSLQILWFANGEDTPWDNTTIVPKTLQAVPSTHLKRKIYVN